MAEMRVKIPEEFEEKIKEVPEMEGMVVEFIKMKIFGSVPIYDSLL